ncbi:hypothetical protein K3495_g16600, partial [Podosphaera aphanis]
MRDVALDVRGGDINKILSTNPIAYKDPWGDGLGPIDPELYEVEPSGDGLGPINPGVYEEDPYGDGLGPIDPKVYEDDEPRRCHSLINSNGGKQWPAVKANTLTSQEPRMNTSPFLVNALLNDTTMVQALV